MSTAAAMGTPSGTGENATASYRAALAAAGVISGHDEALGPVGGEGSATERPWEPVLSTLQTTSRSELRRRWQRANLLIADHGVTYRSHGSKADRPWRLDPVPVVIGPEAWAVLEAGLLQRARLLEAILVDLYGPRRLLQEGVLPPAIILGNPGFFRALQGLRPAGGRHLWLLATDLARDAEGRWVVLGDRTAAPAGVGHAIEHRVVVSRTLPVAFRKSRVRPLGGWFDRHRVATVALGRGAPGGEPRVVLLTPGAGHAAHAEHAYLSRALGFTLVEPADLTVRRRVVYLKTLSGLERVDVVVRRIRDEDCDPLEIEGGAPGGGVPGLLEAQRAGNVAVTNAPGSGLVETPALAAFLPAACRFFFKEDLLLPTAPASWGGDSSPPESLADVVVKPAYAGPKTPGIGPGEAVFGTTLGADAGAALRAAIADRPDAFVFQDRLALSTTPSWRDSPSDPAQGAGVVLTPGRLVLRTFVAATPDGLEAMPGGLGRVSPTPNSWLTSMRRGGGAKDVWVAMGATGAPGGGTPGSAADRVLEAPRTPTVRGASGEALRGGSLPSRVADDLFWLGRYAERAEGTIRLLRAIGRRQENASEPHPRELRALMQALAVVTGMAEPELADKPEPPNKPELSDKPKPSDKPELPATPEPSKATASPEPARPDARAEPSPRDAASDVLAAIFDPAGPHGLASTLAACRQTGGRVRDRLSVDGWRILERLGRDFTSAAEAAQAVEPEDALADAMELFDGMLLTLAAFAGHGHESFTHEEGWLFLDTGRRIERAVFTSELMRALLVKPVWLTAGADPPGNASASEGLLLDALLEVGVSAMTYRARHPGLPRIVQVLELLLFDARNPRAIRWQLDAIARHLADLPDAANRLPDARGDETAESLGDALAAASPVELARVDTKRRPALDALLGRIISRLPKLSNELLRAYVRLTPTGGAVPPEK